MKKKKFRKTLLFSRLNSDRLFWLWKVQHFIKFQMVEKFFDNFHLLLIKNHHNVNLQCILNTIETLACY